MAHLSLTGIRKSFGKVEVLHGIDLEIEDGAFTVLVGPSGCGKSTLLRLVAGLDTITEGEFRMDGRRMNEVPPADRGIGMVFQSYALYPHMTVSENISFGLRLKGMPKKEIAERVGRAAAPLELDRLLDRKPRELSGGQRQRVAIGRALVQEPEVFLFDEPLSNLDAKLRISMRVEIGRLHRHLKATSVYVTHDQVEALTLADKIVIMNAGRIEQTGRPLDLYHRPATAFVAGFIGSPQMNMFPGRVAGFANGVATVRLDAGGEIAVAADPGKAAERVTLGIRPENIRIGAAEDMLNGRIEFVERLGEVSYLHVVMPGMAVPVVVKVEGTASQREGETVGLRFSAVEAHLFDEAGLRCVDTTSSPAAE